MIIAAHAEIEVRELDVVLYNLLPLVAFKNIGDLMPSRRDLC